MEKEPEMVNIIPVFERLEHYLRFNKQRVLAEFALDRLLNKDEINELVEESRTYKMSEEELREALED